MAKPCPNRQQIKTIEISFKRKANKYKSPAQEEHTLLCRTWARCCLLSRICKQALSYLYMYWTWSDEMWNVCGIVIFVHWTWSDETWKMVNYICVENEAEEVNWKYQSEFMLNERGAVELTVELSPDISHLGGRTLGGGSWRLKGV